MEQEEEIKNVKLTSAELSQLWTSYMKETASLCVLGYFIEKVEDEEIKPVIQHAIEISEKQVKTLKGIFNKENYPLPYGFKKEEDVDVSAPRLYSDTFFLYYIHQLGQITIQADSISLSLAVRPDVFSYFNEGLKDFSELLRQTDEILLAKGLYIRSPYLPTPEGIDFVKDKSFLTGYFGEQRPLIATEIANLYANFQRNALGAASLIGFSQVAKSTEVRKFLVRGKEVAKKHCEIFGSTMRQDDLPAPMTWDTEVTDSTAYTFSDKLMTFYTTTLIALSVGYYGASMSMSPRRDIGVMYSRLVAEIMKYADDGAKLMIKHGWMEEPPRALDRDELAKK